MIRQELMDNVEQAMNVLQGALNLDNPPSIRLGCVEEAYKITSNIADLVSKQLKEQNEDIIDCIEYGLVGLTTPISVVPEAREDVREFKEYCVQNNLKSSNGKVLNDYFKDKEVESCQTNGTQI